VDRERRALALAALDRDASAEKPQAEAIVSPSSEEVQGPDLLGSNRANSPTLRGQSMGAITPQLDDLCGPQPAIT